MTSVGRHSRPSRSGIFPMREHQYSAFGHEVAANQFNAVHKGHEARRRQTRKGTVARSGRLVNMLVWSVILGNLNKGQEETQEEYNYEDFNISGDNDWNDAVEAINQLISEQDNPDAIEVKIQKYFREHPEKKSKIKKIVKDIIKKKKGGKKTYKKRRNTYNKRRKTYKRTYKR